MDYKDYYKILGIPKNASQDEIRAAFRRLARQHHPDANAGEKESEEKFKEINEANQVLSDPEKRKKYDQFGSQWQQYSRGGGRPEDFDWSRWATPGGGYTRVTPEDLQGIFGQGFDGFSDFFDALFGRGGMGGAVRPQRGRDVEHPLEITLNEAFQGTTRILQRSAGSRGEVRIPKGVRTGSRVRLSGEGGTGSVAGDLYLKIKVLPHESFERDKDDLRVTVPVDLLTLILGGEVQVPTLEHPVVLKIPPTTANGKTFRLRGLGIPRLKSPDQRGDLFARVEVVLPEKLSGEERELFEKLSKLQKSKSARG